MKDFKFVSYCTVNFYLFNLLFIYKLNQNLTSKTCHKKIALKSDLIVWLVSHTNSLTNIWLYKSISPAYQKTTYLVYNLGNCIVQWQRSCWRISIHWKLIQILTLQIHNTFWWVTSQTRYCDVLWQRDTSTKSNIKYIKNIGF